MKGVRLGLCLLAMASLLLPLLAYGQLQTGGLNGTVTDPTGAVVPNATLQLTDLASGQTLTQKTGSDGQWALTSLKPGTYKLSVSARGFRTLTITQVVVQVGKTLTVPAKLDVGQVSETVEVTSTGQELQTTDASVGNVVDFRSMQGLPSLTRDATALLQIQPMAIPSYAGPNGAGANDITSGQVGGARSDQNTFSLDGGDATSTCEGDNNYVSNSGSPQAVVPTPVESLDEFRVTTTGSVSFARSAGAQVQLVTKRGSNAFHGALYEYNQNTIYNASPWQNNHAGLKRPVWKDNRFGGRLGGPIMKDRAYFFLMYEGERQSQGYNYYRLVPTQNMRNGILTFNGTQYDFSTPVAAAAQVCSGGPCDPRGLGISPAIKKIWSQLPLPNDFSTGDGVNTAGFDYSAPTSAKLNQGIARFDYKLNDKWEAMFSGRYSTAEQITSKQVLVNADGTAKAVFGFPVQPRFYVAGLTGRLTPNVTNDFRFSFLRHWWGWNPEQPTPQDSSLAQVVQIHSESSNTASGMVPLNVDTQNARTRVWNGREYTFNNELSWLKGKHLISIGGTFMREPILHIRNDKVSGGLSIPEAYAVYSSSYLRLSSVGYAPAGFTTSQKGLWDADLTDILGLVGRSSQVLTRNGDLSPAPPGTYVTAHVLVNWYDLHFADTWRMKPTLTVTYGLDWGLQTPPYAFNGQQTIMQYASNGQTVGIHPYLTDLANAAAQGQFYVPTLQFASIRSTGRKYPYDMDWHDFAPRLALAWSPAFDESTLWGRIFGNQKTSIRAGYGRYFDRENGVGLVMTPALGIGFADLSICRSPNMAGVCTGVRTNPSNAFRIGVDGNNIPAPALSTITGNAIIPTNGAVPGNSLYEGNDARIDPFKKTGVEDTWTLNIQRQLSTKTLLELGYVGRVGHHLYNTYDVNAVPYMFKLNGQTFAQAYNAVQKATNFGTNGATPAAQPFFDYVAAANGLANTAELYAQEQTNFQNADVTTIWDDIMPALAPGGVSLPMDSQFGSGYQQMTSSTGASNYHSMYLSLREQAWRGLTFQANYTWSHSFDNTGFGQQWTVITNTNEFAPGVDYVSSFFDMRHVINGFMVYDLPFGAGKRFSSGTSWLNRLIGGWQFTSSFQASSGIPQAMYGYSCTEMGSGYGGNCAAMVTTNGQKFKEKINYVGSQLQVFGSGTPQQAFDTVTAAFQPPYIMDSGHLSGDLIRGLNHWNMDASLNKTTKITERVSFGLSLQAVNVFNHQEFSDYSPSLGDADTSFGLRTRIFNNPRWLNIGMRIDF